jgi:NADH dehydrogenase (ubiquinone) Fe-S protein 1
MIVIVSVSIIHATVIKIINKRELRMLKVTVDGVEVFVQKGSTALQACEAVGVEIPRFCYHERLSIAGNCRMCLVEIEKTPKPVASCAMPVMNGMKIFTDTPLVKKAREAVLEFLLLNHPLDCPICDQGGECDLQDQAVAFGSDRSRFFETKRGVEDKNCGPLINTIMTRCIHCTRCVRFASEIAGVEDLGTTGRGRETEIGTYVEKTFNSELSGNVIDLCPVGALTSKPYTFMARPWELRSTESIDISDGVGSNIRIDSRGTQILRILPRFNEEVNEEWISDKARFSYDGLRVQRLDSPYVRTLPSELYKTTWEEAFERIKILHGNSDVTSVDGSQVGGIVGDLVDSESAFAFKKYLSRLGSSNIIVMEQNENRAISDNLPKDYTFNTSISELEKADAVLLIGVDPRYEASMINLRLRKRYLEGELKVGYIGAPVDLTFPVEHISLGTSGLQDIAQGRHSFCQTLAKAKYPVIICGSSLFELEESGYLVNLLSITKNNIPYLLKGWDGFNVLSNNCNDVGLRNIGFSRKLPSDLSIIYLLGVDSEDLPSLFDPYWPGDPWIIYIGHHADSAVEYAEVILPSTAFTEKRGLYTSTEARVQETNPVLKGPGLAREDWKIFTALSEVICGKTSGKFPFTELRAQLHKIVPIVHSKSNRSTGNRDCAVVLTDSFEFSFREHAYCGNFYSKMSNFYLTNSITRASRVMGQCSTAYGSRTNFVTMK